MAPLRQWRKNLRLALLRRELATVVEENGLAATAGAAGEVSMGGAGPIGPHEELVMRVQQAGVHR